MSSLKLKHSGGNSIIIAGPSSNPAADRTINLNDNYAGNGSFVTANSSGNVGISTASPVAQTTSGGTALTPVLDLKGTGSINNASGVLQFTRKDNSVQGSCIYSCGDEAGLTFRNTDSNGFGFYNGTTQALRIKSTGNVGIGTSNPGAKLQVNDTNPVIAEFYHSDGGTNDQARIALGAYSSNPPSQRGVLLIGENNGAGHHFLVNTSSSHSAGPSAKLRVGSDGSTSIFTTSGNGAAVFTTDIGAGTTYNLFQGRYGASSITSNGTQCFFVTTNGNTYNANNVFASGSDLKLKENIVDAKSQWDDIKALKIRNFNFKNDSNKVKMLGVVAQELEAAGMKGLVDDHADIDADGKELETVTKSVKYSILYMKAIKALQEAITKIETLETKVAALEAG